MLGTTRAVVHTPSVDCNPGQVANNGSSGAAVLPVERCGSHVHVTPLNSRPLYLPTERSSGDEGEAWLHPRAAELEVEVVHPDVAAVDHKPCLFHDEEALPGLQGQEAREGPGGEAERRLCLCLRAVALYTVVRKICQCSNSTS